MRSEHNRGASLAAFLLAVSTVTLLMVSPVEGQVGDACVVTAFPGETGSCPTTELPSDRLLCLSGQCQTCESERVFDNGCFYVNEDQQENCMRDCFGVYVCTSDADCQDDRPTCFIATGATEGQCLLECEVSALPGAAESCPDIPVGEALAGPQLCARLDGMSICLPCARFEENFGITTVAGCELLLDIEQTADVVANCQRECFDYFACTSEGDCPTTQPFCNVPDGETEGVCGECVVGAFPGENGSCPVLEGQDDAGRQICGRSPPDFSSTICVSCFSADEEFEFEFGTDPTAADCQILVTEFNQTEDVSVNCQRECFAVYSCATNADCPDTLPICNAGQCEISVFSALDGMGGGSSA